MSRHRPPAHSLRPGRPGRPGRARRRPLVDRLYALLSLLVILILLAGLPAALIALRGNPLPDNPLDLGMLLERLTAPDDGSLFLAALTWLGWLAWASFALSVMVETAAQMRGFPSPHLPALGPQQRVASVLVATAALLFTAPLLQTPAAAASAGPSAAPATAISTSRDTAEALPSATASAPGPSTQVVPPAPALAEAPASAWYTVQPGDSLWRIAKTRLGDGARYDEIAQLNYGRQQSDGRALPADHWLEPGWTLLLPPDATVEPVAPDAAGHADATDPIQASGHAQPPRTVVVEPGDTLWQIAQDTLGDGDSYPQIAAASTQLQPDGDRLSDPNLIRPGWQLTVPGQPGVPAGANTAQPGAASEPVSAGDDPRGTDSRDAATPDSASAPRAVRPDAGPAPTPATATATDISRADAAQSAAPATDVDADEEPDNVRTAAGIGAVLAAGVLALLAGRRARQQRRRRPGQRIAMPGPALAATELELRRVEDPDAQVRIDQAIRTLSLLLAEAAGVLPRLRLARLSDGQLELYLDEPAVLPAPFTATGDPTVWTLLPDAPLPSAAELAAVPAPYPSLVTLGHDLDGAHILVDLEHCGSLAVTGDPMTTTAVLAALATQLATSAWADDLQVTLVDCLPQLPEVLGTGRLRHVTDTDALLRALESRSAAVRASLASAGVPDLQHARTATTAGQANADSWTPEIVLLAQPLPVADRERLRALLHDLPQVGLAAVTADEALLGGWTLALDTCDSGTNGVAALHPVGLSLRPQQLTDNELGRLLDLLAVTDMPGRPATDVPDAELVADEPTLADLGAQLVQPGTEQPGLPVMNAQSYPTPPARDLDSDMAGAGEAQQRGVQELQHDDPHTIAGDTAMLGKTDGEPASPIAPDPEEAHGDTDPLPPPLVQLLGPVELVHPRGAVERSKQRQLTEIAAYLALHPGRDHHHLSEAIWPGARTLDNTRNTAMSKLRKWLGSTADGQDYVPRVLGDGYRLHPAVRSDWDLFRQLLPDGPAAADTSALAAALELVQGRPLAGTNPRRYAWAEPDRQDMISTIVDAAHELARRALLDGNAPLARHAAAAGLQADPGAELLWRDALRAEWLAGDITGLTTTADRLSALTDELGDDLEPETIELLDELLNHRTRQAAAP